MNKIGTIFRREFGGYFATPLAYVFIVIFLEGVAGCGKGVGREVWSDR